MSASAPYGAGPDPPPNGEAGGAPGEAPRDRGKRVDPRRDPTRMANQPALRSSTGRIWLVMGALFAAASLVPLWALVFVNPGPSRPVAIVTGILVILCYAAMLIVRFTSPRGERRLRLLAIAMLTMAGIAVIGTLLCLMWEAAPR